jgi:hypothetical protein
MKMGSDRKPSYQRYGRVIAPIVMIGCALASLFIGLTVDGNGSFLGLSEQVSILIGITNATVGIASAAFVSFWLRRWQIVAAVAIAIHLMLFVPSMVTMVLSWICLS